MAEPSEGPNESDARDAAEDERLLAVFRDPALPEVDVKRGGGARHFLVWRTVALAEARLGHHRDMEQRLDSYVSGVGGRRLGMVDPWRFITDLVRRVRRLPLPPNEDIYEIPEEILR